MRQRLFCIAVATAATALAGAASAQTLPQRDDPAWEAIGTTADGTRYDILPGRTSREDTTVRLVLRATVAPSPTGSPNAVVAYAVVDCAASAIGVGKTEFYSVTQGFLRTVEGPEDPAPSPATDPGQLMVIRHVCTDRAAGT
jgi:hypothetical protein